MPSTNSAGHSKSEVPKYCNTADVHPSKEGSNTVLVTVSIPAESIITLPTKALEIKMIRNNLKITQSRFFNCVPSDPGIPNDTPKLFLGGFVRKDIQYSEAIQQTATSVSGVMKDFVVDIPISCVIDLGKHIIFPPIIIINRQNTDFRNRPRFPHDKECMHCYTKQDKYRDSKTKVIFHRINAILAKLTRKVKGPHVASNRRPQGC